MSPIIARDWIFGVWSRYSDGRSELVDGDRDSQLDGFVNAELVVAAAEVLHEGVAVGRTRGC